MAAQPSRDDRRRDADVVIENSGTSEELEAEVDRVWEWITSLADGADDDPES